MKKKFIFKISLLMLALVCAFATLGAYTWAFEYSEEEAIIYNDNTPNAKNNDIYITLNNLSKVNECYVAINFIEDDEIQYLSLLEVEYSEEMEKYQYKFGIYLSKNETYLVDLDDNFYAYTDTNSNKINATNFITNYEENWGALDNTKVYVVNGEYPQQTTQTTIYNSTCENLAEIVASFAVLLGSLFVSVAQIFYYNNALTTIGILSLVGVGVGLALWGFKYIRKLIKVRTKK